MLLFLDVPSRVSNLVTDTNNWDFYQNWAGGDPCSVSVQLQSVAPNWLPLVTHLNMNGTNDCIAYINKLKAFGTNTALIISASAGVNGNTNYGNTNYVVDNVRTGYGYAPSSLLKYSFSTLITCKKANESEGHF